METNDQSYKVRVLKQLLAGQPALGLQHNHLLQEVQLDLVEVHRQLLPTLHQALQLPLPQTLLHPRVLHLPRVRPNYREDALHLLDLVVGPEESLAGLHKVEDAAQGPDIHLICVSCFPEQQFWSPVVERSHLVSHISAFPGHLSGHPVVDHLELVCFGAHLQRLSEGSSLALQHDIRRFQISMENVLGMEDFNCLDKFCEELFDGIFLPGVQELFQTHGQPFDDHGWGFLMCKHFDDFGDSLAAEHGHDVVFPHEAAGESDLCRSFEPFDCHYFFGESVLSLVDFPIGAFSYQLQELVLV